MVPVETWRLQVHRVWSPDILDRFVSTPVLIALGARVSLGDYMMSPRRESLPFVLADNGFDVYLTNFLGNQLSNGKVTPSGEIVRAVGQDLYESL